MMTVGIKTLWILIFISSYASAFEKCQLFDHQVDSIKSLIEDSSTTRIYTFKNKTLICVAKKNLNSKFNNAKPMGNYTIIRSHKDEISKNEILASSYGYHLIDKPITCQNEHCGHMHSMPLIEFNNIKPSRKNSSHTSSTIDPDIEKMVSMIDSNLWKSDIVTLSSWSRVSTTSDNDSAATWIANNMIELNLTTSTPVFTVSGNPTRNIMGIQIGTTRVDDWYVVGAHMDSIPSNGGAPGAIDNASGCAGVLEMARIASQFTFEGTLIFMCYSGEEQGLFGSQFHVSSLIDEGDKSKVKAVLTMDMIGFTDNSSENRVLIESSSSFQWLIDVLVDSANNYAPNLSVVTSTNPFGSDHVPYIFNGIPGILSIDLDWDIYPDYHRSSDLPENVNLNQGEYILKTNLAALATLATLINTDDFIFVNGFE
ncbi:MAG: M28 family metallopeptidase [Marinicellaceae bacterium]